jgi:predicted amidophosphoribosyltransferase
MVKCPYCNKELSDNEMFCWNCEADLTEEKNKREKPGAEGH